MGQIWPAGLFFQAIEKGPKKQFWIIQKEKVKCITHFCDTLTRGDANGNKTNSWLTGSFLPTCWRHSVSSTKLCPTLPVNTTRNYTQLCFMPHNRKICVNLPAQKLLKKRYWNWPHMSILSTYDTQRLRQKITKPKHN